MVRLFEKLTVEIDISKQKRISAIQLSESKMSHNYFASRRLGVFAKIYAPITV